MSVALAAPAMAVLCGCGEVVVQHGTHPDAPLSSGDAIPGSPGSPFAGLPSAPAAAAVNALYVRPLGGGAQVALGSLRGARATVVAFWATYCAPCAGELPGLQRLAPTLLRQGVRVVLVDLMEDGGRARDWLAGHGVGLAAYVDGDGSAHDGLHLLGVPTTAVLAADGSVAARLEGSTDNAGLADVLHGMGISTQ
jgi:thiol-disulfide isomerase/thioredoxin